MNELELRIATLEAKAMITRGLLAQMISRAAGEYDDPAQYIMTLMAPGAAAAESFDEPDPASRHIHEALLEYVQGIETQALDFVQ